MRVVFAARVAPYIRVRLWHPSQRFCDLDDGRLEMLLRVADTLEVRRWILGYDVDAEVVEPEALREELRREAEGLVATLVPRRRPPAAARPEAGARAARRGRRREAGGAAGSGPASFESLARTA